MRVEFELIPRSDLQLGDRCVSLDSAAVTMKPGMTSIPVLLYLGDGSDSDKPVYRVTLKEDEK